jgi:hypothetical protein
LLIFAPHLIRLRARTQISVLGRVTMIFRKPPRRRRIAGKFCVRTAIAIAIAIAFSVQTPAQTIENSEAQLGRIMGTVVDVNGDAVARATVALSGPDPADRRTVATSDTGFFQFDEVKPGVPERLNIGAEGFAGWASPDITLAPGEFKSLGGIELALATQQTSMVVTSDPIEAATEQLRVEEKQRVLGFIPNFYVSYDSSAAALTARMKFQLALKVSIDPVTVAGIALIAGAKQAANTPNVGQGAVGYGERFGIVAADASTDILIGGAILPSLLHQDPRYFYQGTGTTRSRVRHAILAPFIARGDNGRPQPNYSSLGGDLISSSLSNLYYPRSNRGVSLVFGNFAIATAERIGASVAQEFVFGRLTHRGGHIE